jgi:hypothetical protein
MTDFFANIPKVRYEGPETENEFAFRHYDADEVVMGKPDGGPPALRGRLLALLRLARR